MATITAHKGSAGKLETLYTWYNYCNDGKVLINTGSGWKKLGKIKPGVSPLQAYQKAKEKLDNTLAKNPCYAKFQNTLHSMTTQKNRLSVYFRVVDCKNDSDGLFSYFDDTCWSSDNPHLTIDDCLALCKTYNAMKEEQALNKTIIES
jgi:hypothetical protein